MGNDLAKNKELLGLRFSLKCIVKAVVFSQNLPYVELERF